MEDKTSISENNDCELDRAQNFFCLPSSKDKSINFSADE